jgi:hypothetical protein
MDNQRKTGKSILTISKSQLVENFYQRLLDSYGYSKNQVAKNVSIFSHSVADIAIWRSEEEKIQGRTPNIYVLVACRTEHIRIEAEDYFGQFKQAALNNMTFYVAHNLKETKVFYIDKNARPFKIEHISDFPHSEDIITDNSLELFVNKMRAYSKDVFLKSLSRCHNIIRNIDKFSPEAAFDEISKVLFLKILYERDAKDELIYSKEKFLKDEKVFLTEHPKEDYIQHLFAKVKHNYSADGLFDE